MVRDLRRRAGTARVVREFEDGSKELEMDNGRRLRMQFRRCPGCKVERPISNFTMALCLHCRQIKAPIETRYECIKPTGQKLYKSRRYAILKQATPPWVDKRAIAEKYEEARRKTKETGIPHHVDHIWPLVHECFSGLHVPWNLRVIPSVNNLTKKNTAPIDFYQ
jgi:hypothetical protein